MPKHEKKKNISLNNLRSKHSMSMKSGQFMSYYKKQKLSKSFTKTASRELVLDPFVFTKNWGHPLSENGTFEASYLY